VRIGIDIGGTKIEALALDDQGHERLRRRVAMPRGDYPGTLVAIVELVGHFERELGERCSVGVGHPGVTSPATGTIKNSNSTCLNGQRFAEDLERVLARPVRLANDANCFAVSEATDGAAAGLSIVFGVILGTGVGGGLVVEGRALVGANAIAGEWGHVPLPRMADEERPWPVCDCGRVGCLTCCGRAACWTRIRWRSDPGDAKQLMRKVLGTKRMAFFEYDMAQKYLEWNELPASARAPR